MKLTINPQDLVEAVTWSMQGYDSKDTQSYLALNIDKERGTASLTYSGTSSHMKAPLPIAGLEFEDGEDETHYSIPLDGSYLKNLAQVTKRLGIEELKFSKRVEKKNDPLKVRGDKQSFTVPVLTIATKKEPKLSTLGEVNSLDFFSALQRLAKLCTLATADTGAATGSVAVKLTEDGKLVLMGTDSFSLGEIILDYSPNEEEVKEFTEKSSTGATLLVSRAAALTVKPSKQTHEHVSLVYEAKSKRFGYSFEDGRVALFSLEQDTPTIYESLKSNVLRLSDASVDVALQEFTRAIEAISSLNPEEVDINLKIEGGKKPKLTLSDGKKSNIVTLSALAANFKGELSISFFREVILKSLTPVAHSTVRIFFAQDEPKMVVIRGVKEDGSEVDATVFSLAVVAM